MGGRRKLSPRLVAGLDVSRAIAALYVVAHHIAGSRDWSHGFGLTLRFGQEAVLVFFLLSGFVIFANERERAVHPVGYYLRRLRRIYPALIIAMIVSALVALDNRSLAAAFNWRDFAATILNLQDVPELKPGVIARPFLGNTPLWSLSYEIAFYAAFPLVLIVWKRFPVLTNHAVGALCSAALVHYSIAPNHWSLVGAYFLVWWCGAMAANAYLSGGVNIRSMKVPFVWLLMLCVTSAGIVATVGFRGLGVYPFLMLRHFAVAAFLLAALFGSFGASLASLAAKISKPAAGLASISYGLYVLHYPLLVSWDRAYSFLGFTVASTALVVMAFLADKQLNSWLPKVRFG